MLKTGMAHWIAELVLQVGSGGTDTRGRMRWEGTGLLYSDRW